METAAPPRLIRRLALWALPLLALGLVLGAAGPVLAPAAPSPPTAARPTATPFQPLSNTPTLPAKTAATLTPEPAATLTPEPAASPMPEPAAQTVTDGWRWWGLDFAPGAPKTHVTVDAPGGELEITIRPGDPCQYWDHRACVSLHLVSGAPVLLASVHSGLGSEAEELRFRMEGMGLNRAVVPLDEIQARLAELQGSGITLDQENLPPLNLRVLAALRIPAAQLDEYFSQPFDAALTLAASQDTSLSSALGRPLLVIETCGWWHPEEAWAPGITSTSASVYLLVMGE